MHFHCFLGINKTQWAETFIGWLYDVFIESTLPMVYLHFQIQSCRWNLLCIHVQTLFCPDFEAIEQHLNSWRDCKILVMFAKLLLGILSFVQKTHGAKKLPSATFFFQCPYFVCFHMRVLQMESIYLDDWFLWQL